MCSVFFFFFDLLCVYTVAKCAYVDTQKFMQTHIHAYSALCDKFVYWAA